MLRLRFLLLTTLLLNWIRQIACSHVMARANTYTCWSEPLLVLAKAQRTNSKRKAVGMKSMFLFNPNNLTCRKIGTTRRINYIRVLSCQWILNSANANPLINWIPPRRFVWSRTSCYLLPAEISLLSGRQVTLYLNFIIT